MPSPSFFKEVDLRYRKRAEDLGDVRKEIVGLEGRAKAALGKLRKFVPREGMAIFTDLEHSLREFHDLSTRAQQRIEEVEADSRQMVQMAGVGLLVEMVAHELARSTESALASLEGLRGKDLPQEVKARLDTLRAEIKSVSKRLRVLDLFWSAGAAKIGFAICGAQGEGQQERAENCRLSSPPACR